MRITYVENSRLFESGDVFECCDLEQDDARRLGEMRDWCTAQFGDRIGKYPRWKFDRFHQPEFNRSAFFFWFEREDDAMFFKMRWF